MFAYLHPIVGGEVVRLRVVYTAMPRIIIV